MKTIYWFNYTLWRSIFNAVFSLRIVGQEKLVEDGPVLIVSNHESYIDPPLVGVIYHRAVHFLARKTLFRSFGAWLFPRMNVVPVDQERPDMTSLKNIIKLLRNNNRVVVFPEGSRTLDGQLQPGQAGTGLIIAKSRAVVQPLRIFGAHEILPRGSAKLSVSPLTIVVGDPIVFSAEELKAKGRDGYQKIADRVMDEIARITPEG